jgi:hypothetical protein
MAEILLARSSSAYKSCGPDHKLITDISIAQSLVTSGLESGEPSTVLAALHHSGHQDLDGRALVPEARSQLGSLKDLSVPIAQGKLGDDASALLGRAVFTSARILGKGSDMNSTDADGLIKIFDDFLSVRANTLGSEQAKADLTGITAFGLGELGEPAVVQQFLNSVYVDARLDLNTDLTHNQRASETRKLLLHAIEYALDYGGIPEVSIAIGRLGEFERLLSQVTPDAARRHSDWIECFRGALQNLPNRIKGLEKVVNPLNQKEVTVQDTVKLLGLYM